MPAFRYHSRRRSSVAKLSFNPAKPGIYGIGLPPPAAKPVTFAPNVTPGTYVEPDDAFDETLLLSSSLFPPSEIPAQTQSRRRVPPGKRRSQGYIPRPPNAFMLFRADFVRQKHVPGTIETNHGSLSKIIGNCWRALPLDEKKVWEVRAKHAKAEHKLKYPNYRFRPVHNKNKDKKKDKTMPTPEDERRCEEVAQFLLEGKKGEQLAEAVRNLDRIRSQTPVIAPAPVMQHRRSSSVPLPNDYYNPYATNITLPTTSFFLQPMRPPSPSRQQRIMHGQQQRRPSSAGPTFFRSWNTLMHNDIFEQDETITHFPEPDPSLLQDFSNFNFASPAQHTPPFGVNDLMPTLPPHENVHAHQLHLDPLQSLGPQDVLSHMYSGSAPTPSDQNSLVSNNNSNEMPDLDMNNWLSGTLEQSPSIPSSQTSSSYSGSPPPSDKTLPPMFAPQPIHAGQTPTSHMFTGMDNLGGVGVDVWGQTDVGYGQHDQLTQSLFQPEHGVCGNGADSYPYIDHGFDFGTGSQMTEYAKREA